MSDEGVTIERGLPQELRAEAARIFEEAFGSKMGMAVRDPEKRLEFLRRSFIAEHAIIARRGAHLLGMAGLSAKGGPYDGGLMGRSWDPRPVRDLLGWSGAMWAIWGMRLSDHRPKADEIYVDGIAVSAQARSLGIGTRLLGEATNIAREEGKRFVRLDVIDRNPRAQALYARLGYKVTKVQSFSYKERWVGFGGMTSMELPVAPVEPTAPAENAAPDDAS